MKITLFLISFLILSGFLVALFQNNIIKIEADTWPILIKGNINHLAFGTVFPGEQLEKNLTVLYSGSGDGSYTITEKHKPLPDAEIPTDYQRGNISDYCQEFPDDLEKCYRNLCPHITEYSNEEEGDTIDNASVSANDLSDLWVVHLDSPAIAGKISQDHIGGIISVNGDYGCDLSFDVNTKKTEFYCGDGIVNGDEECDDGNNINGDGCSNICKTESSTIITGGGGGGYTSLKINKSDDCVPTKDGASFSWMTNKNSSSRVVCDTKSNPNWGTPPSYGHTLFTNEYDLSSKVLSHGVEITGLLPGKTYYCRVISSNSLNTIFEEVVCSIPEKEKKEEIEEKGEVKGTSIIIPSGLPKTGHGSEI